MPDKSLDELIDEKLSARDEQVAELQKRLEDAEKRATEAEERAATATVKSAVPLTLVPEHAAGPGLEVAETWCQADQERARLEAG